MNSEKEKLELNILREQLQSISKRPNLWGINECTEIYAMHAFQILMTIHNEDWPFEKTQSVWTSIARQEFNDTRFAFTTFCNEQSLKNYWNDATFTNQLVWESLIDIRKRLQSLSQDTFPHFEIWLNHLQKNRRLLTCPLYTDEVLTNLIFGSFIDGDIQNYGRSLYRESCKKLLSTNKPNQSIAFVGLKQDKKVYPFPTPPKETERMKIGLSKILDFLVTHEIF